MILFKHGTSAARRRRTGPGVELGVWGSPVSRRGLVRRLACGLLALLLVVHLTFSPRAFGVALPAVAAGTVVTAFLMASGIYPYDEQAEFAEYVSENLSPLWSQYLDWRTEQSMNPPETGTDLSKLTGYLTQGVVAISRSVWNTLTEFTSWVVSHFNLTDNQTAVELGITSSKSGFADVPVYASPSNNAILRANGFELFPPSNLTNQSAGLYVSASVPGVYLCAYYQNAYDYNRHIVLVSDLSFEAWRTNFNAPDSYTPDRMSSSFSSLWSVYYVDFFCPVSGPYAWTNFPYYADIKSVDGVLSLYVGVQSSFSGVTADTTTVSPPAALPADTPWGGLAVEGTGASATVGAVEQVIQEGVIGRERPIVRPVEVEIQAGTEVDSETGEITENPVVITPSDIPLVASDYAIPGLHTVFPFSIPWDIYNVYSALNATPTRPSFDASLYVPVLDVSIPFKIEIPEEISEDVDNFVAVARSLFLVLMCVATLLFVRDLIR